jgi:hypothetical protein
MQYLLEEFKYFYYGCRFLSEFALWVINIVYLLRVLGYNFLIHVFIICKGTKRNRIYKVLIASYLLKKVIICD